MDWEKILSAIILGGLILFLYPRMRKEAKDAPKGTADDWKGVLFPLLGVVLFIVFLIMMAKS